jgi:hypothetical protein
MGGSVEPPRVGGGVIDARLLREAGEALRHAARRSVRIRPGAATKRRAHWPRTPRIASPRASNDRRQQTPPRRCARHGGKERAGRGGRGWDTAQRYARRPIGRHLLFRCIYSERLPS